MRRVNVDRMRRHMARTTPDRRRWRFTIADMLTAAPDDPDRLVGQHLDHWGALMARKHGDRGRNPEVTVWREGGDPLGAAVVQAEVRTP